MKGVVVRSLKRFTDERGWLTELFRSDEIDAEIVPKMSYLSVTKPGVARGPHEHVDQTDIFAFLHGSYRLLLWENRPNEPEAREEHFVGADNPTVVIVPPGVVHAYQNVGESEAYVLNFPNQLYAGEGKKFPVDEIRHEEDGDSRFKI